MKLVKAKDKSIATIKLFRGVLDISLSRSVEIVREELILTEVEFSHLKDVVDVITDLGDLPVDKLHYAMVDLLKARDFLYLHYSQSLNFDAEDSIMIDSIDCSDQLRDLLNRITGMIDVAKAEARSDLKG